MKMSWAGPAEELESTCEESAQEGAGGEQAPEGIGEEQALEGAAEEWAPESAVEERALESTASHHIPLTSPGVPGGARVARNWTEPAGTKVSWTGPAEAKVSWTGPAEAKVSWTGPAEALTLEGALVALAGLRELRTAADFPCWVRSSVGVELCVHAHLEYTKHILSGRNKNEVNILWAANWRLTENSF